MCCTIKKRSLPHTLQQEKNVLIKRKCLANFFVLFVFFTIPIVSEKKEEINIKSVLNQKSYLFVHWNSYFISILNLFSLVWFNRKIILLCFVWPKFLSYFFIGYFIDFFFYERKAHFFSLLDLKILYHNSIENK